MNKSASTILVVEDEPISRMTMCALIEGIGYRVEIAENGSQALAKAREIQPDLILLDVMMPGMDGYEVCRQLRADAELAQVPIFMVTALDDRESRLQGLAAGADDFLAKPVDILELEIRLNVLKQVARYRHLLDERAMLNRAMAQLAEKNEQLHRLSQQVITTQENERRLLALELHDEIGQILTGLKLILEQRDVDMALVVAEARSVTNELLHKVRELSLNLRPTVLDDFGLSAALDWLIKRYSDQTGIYVYHNIDPLSERRFSRLIETSVFRVAQEALTNVARHAQAREVNLTLNVEPDRLQLSISDGGRGFNPAELQPGTSTGLSGMEERVALAGGVFGLQSVPGEGTLIQVDFDLKAGVN
jgi:signal transduction histidine kinase